MKTKNTRYVIVILLALTLMIGACAQQPSQETPEGQKIIVRQWEYSADPNAIQVSQQMVRDFNDQSDTIEIRLELIPRDIVRQKLLAAIEAGDPPDLVRFDLPWTPEFASAGKLVDLTDRVSDWDDINDFYEARLETVLLDGKFFGIPSNSNNLALVYNIDMIEAAGITEPPTTWAELKEYAQILTVVEGGAIDIAGLLIGGARNETIPFHYLPWLWQAGGDVDNINSLAGVRALEEWKSYLTDGIIPQGMLGWGNADLRQQFEAGKTAMMINGPGHVAAIPNNAPDINFGIWLLPCDVECASVIGGEDWVIPYGSKNVDAAWEVLKYYSSPEIHQWWCESTNTLPSRLSVGTADIFMTDPVLRVFVEQNAVALPRPVHPQYAEISDIIQVAVQSALTDQMSAQEALNQAHGQISEILN